MDINPNMTIRDIEKMSRDMIKFRVNHSIFPSSIPVYVASVLSLGLTVNHYLVKGSGWWQVSSDCVLVMEEPSSDYKNFTIHKLPFLKTYSVSYAHIRMDDMDGQQTRMERNDRVKESIATLLENVLLHKTTI